jgi:hypothetical protein
MGRLVSWGVGAVEPVMFGLGPVPADRQALERAGWKIGDALSYVLCSPRLRRMSAMAHSCRFAFDRF